MLSRINNNLIETYDSIKDLPIDRFMEYNRNVLIEAGIGSDLGSFSQRCGTIGRLIDKDPKSAKKEVNNLDQTVRFIVGKTSPKMIAFVFLIKAINGQEITDRQLTEDGVNKILSQLNEMKVSIGFIEKTLDAIKKKFAAEFEVVFPGRVNDPETRENYAQLKRRVLLVLRYAQGVQPDAPEEIAKIDELILDRIKPKVYGGPKGLEVRKIKDFETTCIIMKQHNVAEEPRKLSTLAFFQALDVIEEQTKKRKQ